MRKRIPYGYRVVNGRAEADPVEAPKLQSFFEMVADGEPAASAARIAGIDRTPNTCRVMLGHKVYLGTDYYPRLISNDLWCSASMEAARRGAPFVGKVGKPVTEPNPILTQFAMDRGSVRSDDPAGYAALLYERIRPRKKKQVANAPADVSGRFLHEEEN